MGNLNKKNILLHLTFILLSFPSLFAKGLDIPANILSWWRCLFAALIAFTILFITKQYKISKTQLKWLAITGTLMGLHWWAYFASIQLSTVAIGLLALFTSPIIIVILEPLIFKTKTSKKQIIGALGIIVGIFILIPEFTLSNSTTQGVLVGLLAAFFISLRNILTRKYLGEIKAFKIMGYHVFFAFSILTIPMLWNMQDIIIPNINEMGLILVLAVLFTLGSHGLLVYSLKNFTAAKVGILGSLQVIYGTLLAFAFFNEIPNYRFYIGASIILSVAIYEMIPEKNR